MSPSGIPVQAKIRYAEAKCSALDEIHLVSILILQESFVTSPTRGCLENIHEGAQELRV
jgi:hypothetical protein